VQNKDNRKLAGYGFPEGLARVLGTSHTSGLDPEAKGTLTIERRQEFYGANKFKERTTKGLLVLVFEQLKDPTLILLMCAAAVSLRLPTPKPVNPNRDLL
jgi:Ca2+-transporting ATPase